jgi:catechol 2,3-dioxygenase-like lactoylglutathione lyase family enzyme
MDCIGGRNAGFTADCQPLQTRFRRASYHPFLAVAAFPADHSGMTPKATGITESALYVDDVPRAVEFYEDLLGCKTILGDERFCVLRIVPGQVLLIFLRGASTLPADLGFGTIIGHDGSGPLHVCFGIGAGEVEAWEKRLADLGIPIESRIDWPRGATSLYFRDPDGHAVELATPGLWPDEA